MTFGTLDYREPRPLTKGEFYRLQALARQLVGETALFGAIEYPHEMTIHFGQPLEFKGPRGTTLVEGSYVLGAVCSAWRIKSAAQGRAVIDYAVPPDALRGQPTLPLISEKQVEEFLSHIGGATVREVEVLLASQGYGLRITLSDGSLVELFPTPDHFEIGPNDPIPIPPPDWELFTPYKRYLQVGPGLQWAYLPSDEPEKKKG